MVSGPQCPDDALLLIAHGARRHAGAARLVQVHAAALRDERHFAEVAVGLLDGTPSARDALEGLSSHIVHVVPFFMESGWFVQEAVPRALQAGQGHVLHYHQPVGLHPDLAGLAATRVRRRCGHDSGRFSVLLAGHGSARAPGRSMTLHRHAETLSARRCFARVCAAFLEEPPFIADTLYSWRTMPVAVVGFFAGEGGHVRDDVPALLGAERAARGSAGAPLLDLGVIADDPEMPRIILDQVSGRCT
jgi:sirohydrochlorin ferrochelatase